MGIYRKHRRLALGLLPVLALGVAFILVRRTDSEDATQGSLTPGVAARQNLAPEMGPNRPSSIEKLEPVAPNNADATTAAVSRWNPDAGVGEAERRIMHEARRAARQQARADWQTRRDSRKEAKRQRILAEVAGDPEKVERWRERFEKRDAQEERAAKRREERRENGKLAGHPIGSDEPSAESLPQRGPVVVAPVLGPPVIGADGVAYDPSAH